MATDIRIGAGAFNYADAWIKGVQAGQQQAMVDLSWEKWIAEQEKQAKVEEAAAKATAERDKVNAAGATAADAAETARAVNLVGSQKDRANYIMSRLRTVHGLTPEAAAAMTGNWIQESGLSTTARNKGDGKDGTDSIGLGQWNSNRAVQLKAFASRTGKDWTDLNTQVDFAAWELSNTHKSVGAALSNPSLSVTQASDIVHRRYEVAELGSAGKRRSNSASVLAGYDPSAPSARELQVRQPDGTVAAYGQGYRAGAEQGPPAPAMVGGTPAIRVQSRTGQVPVTGPMVTSGVPTAAVEPPQAPVAAPPVPGASIGLPSLGAPLAPDARDFGVPAFGAPPGPRWPTVAPQTGDPLQPWRNRTSSLDPGYISPQQMADNEQMFDPNLFFPGSA